jgi:perosamine synthetase
MSQRIETEPGVSGVAAGPRARIPVAAPLIGARDVEYVADAVRSGWVSSIGPYLDHFERDFAAFCGTRHGVAVCNGTASLHLALAALGIGPGDEVIVPDLTFAATAHAVILAGATPVFADVDPETWCIDPCALDRAIGPRTRAVIPVHLYGHPADMDAILALTATRGIVVIEDAAEAHGARVGSTRVGAIGTVGSFSFYGNKIITTGEGGMLTTDDAALAARLRFLRDHGMTKARRYFHTELAFNYAMSNMQAALGVAQLEKVDQLLAKKRDVFGWYARRLRGRVGLNAERDGYIATYWMVCAVLSAGDPAERDAVCARLSERGIETRPFFTAMSRLPHLRSCRAVSPDGDGCPVAVGVSERGFNLPSGCGLERGDVEYVCDILLEML